MLSLDRRDLEPELFEEIRDNGVEVDVFASVFQAFFKQAPGDAQRPQESATQKSFGDNDEK